MLATAPTAGVGVDMDNAHQLLEEMPSRLQDWLPFSMEQSPTSEGNVMSNVSCANHLSSYLWLYFTQGMLDTYIKLNGYQLVSSSLWLEQQKGLERRLLWSLEIWIHGNSRDLATDVVLPYLESTTNSYGGFPYAQRVPGLLLHVALGINVLEGAHVLQPNQREEARWSIESLLSARADAADSPEYVKFDPTSRYRQFIDVLSKGALKTVYMMFDD